MCGQQFNRSGTLCGRCRDGYYPLVYSSDMRCVPCPDGEKNWYKYTLAAFLPLTIFYFLIMFFRINVSSSQFYAFVHFSQVVTMPAIARAIITSTRFRPLLQKGVRVMGNIYGIWNMDFFRLSNYDICLGTDTLQTLSLDVVVGVYPLLLMMLSYVLIRLYDRNYRVLIYIWKPFKMIFSLFCKNWEIKTSLIDAFATFFLLSNVKLISVSFDLLMPVKVYQLNSTGHLSYSWRLFYDATLQYFGERHYKYAILAIVILTLDVLLPLMLLLLYPFTWFQKFLNLFPLRWYVLHTFMDSFHGCYKDGTEPGTRDCRWFASMFLVIHISFFTLGGATLGSVFFVFNAIIEIVAALLLVSIQPFKPQLNYYSDVHVKFHLLLAILCTSFLGALEAELGRKPALTVTLYTSMAIVGILPLLYVCFVVLHWLCSHRKFAVEKLVAWRHGYDIIE